MVNSKFTVYRVLMTILLSFNDRVLIVFKVAFCAHPFITVFIQNEEDPLLQYKRGVLKNY